MSEHEAMHMMIMTQYLDTLKESLVLNLAQ